MIYSQYLRLETKAGGAACTDKQFIKACHTVLSDHGKSYKERMDRHNWIKQGLSLLNQVRKNLTAHYK